MKKLTIVCADDAAAALFGLLSGKDIKLGDIQSFHIEDVAVEPTGQDLRARRFTNRMPRQVGKSAKTQLANHFSLGVAFKTEAASRYLQGLGYSPKSASPAVSELLSHGFVTLDKRTHTYAFTKTIPANYNWTVGRK